MTTPENPKGILLVVSGPSGTGKGTVNHLLIESHPGEYAFSVSATTRAPREGEQDGIDYHFVDKATFESYIANGEMLEYTCYCGNYYGTPKSELKKLDGGKNLILEIEVEGASNIKRLIPDSVTVFILPPSLDALRSRLVSRGTNTPEDIEKRIARARDEFLLSSEYDYVVVNAENGIKGAADSVHCIVTAEKQKSSRYTDAVKKLFG